MKVKFKKCPPGMGYTAPYEYEVSEAVGKRMIENGYADPVDSSAKRGQPAQSDQRQTQKKSKSTK